MHCPGCLSHIVLHFFNFHSCCLLMATCYSKGTNNDLLVKAINISVVIKKRAPVLFTLATCSFRFQLTFATSETAVHLHLCSGSIADDELGIVSCQRIDYIFYFCFHFSPCQNVVICCCFLDVVSLIQCCFVPFYLNDKLH